MSFFVLWYITVGIVLTVYSEHNTPSKKKYAYTLRYWVETYLAVLLWASVLPFFLKTKP